MEMFNVKGDFIKMEKVKVIIGCNDKMLKCKKCKCNNCIGLRNCLNKVELCKNNENYIIVNCFLEDVLTNKQI